MKIKQETVHLNLIYLKCISILYIFYEVMCQYIVSLGASIFFIG